MIESMIVLIALITLTACYLTARVYAAKKANERVYLARGYALVVIKTKTGKSYKGYVPRVTLRNLKKGYKMTIEVEGIRGKDKTLIMSEDITEMRQLKPPV